MMPEARVVGANTITLNEATMIRAVQSYLDSMTTTPGRLGRVSAVKAVRGTPGLCRQFEINLDGPS